MTNYLLPHSPILLLQRDALVTGYYFDRKAPVVDQNMNPVRVAPTKGVVGTPAALVLPQGQFYMVRGWDPGTIRTLITLRNQAQSNPEMVEDLGLIDAFFELGQHGTTGFNAMWAGIGSGNGDRFFFPPLPPIPGAQRGDPKGGQASVWYTRGVLQNEARRGGPDLAFRERAFGLDRNRPWGELKPQVLNILAAENVLKSYPWPPPRATMQYAWFYQDKIREQFWKFLLSPKIPLREADIRTVITLLFVQNYEALQGEVEWAEKERAKREKRNALIRGIATAIASTVFSLFTMPAIISTSISLLFQTVDIADKVAMARGLAIAAKQFEDTEAEFAAELNRVSALSDAEAAKQEAAKKTLSTPEAMVAAEQSQAYMVKVDAAEVGKADNPEGAAKLAKEKTKPGQTAEVFFQGKSVGKFTAPVEEPSKFPWWIPIAAGAGYVLL